MKKSGKWYLYHIEDGKIVVDVAQHSDHHAQAHAAMGKPPPRYVGGSFEPFSQEDIERREKQLGLKFDSAPRKALPEFVEPQEWAKHRANRAAAAAAKGAK